MLTLALGGAILAPEYSVSPIANDRRSIVEVKLKPELVVPKGFAAARHSSKNEATSFLAVCDIHIPPHLQSANGHVNYPAPFVDGLETDSVWAF